VRCTSNEKRRAGQQSAKERADARSTSWNWNGCAGEHAPPPKCSREKLSGASSGKRNKCRQAERGVEDAETAVRRP
jgi:hypothetical protein